MKNLKKHPKQQRMEDMKIPGSTTATEVAYDIREEAVKEYIRRRLATRENDARQFRHEREYLRSINNQHHHWHLLAGLILIGAIIIAAVVIL